jgi:hypothetical protein
LQNAARREGALLRFVEGDERETLIRLIKRGDIELSHNADFRAEMAACLRPNGSAGTDGVPGFALGMSDFVSQVAPLALRVFDMGQFIASREKNLAQQAPLLAILETEEESPRAWIAAGQALSHVLVRACAEGAYASFLNSPVAVNALWAELRHSLGLKCFPQIVLRIGLVPAGIGIRATPRRGVTEVMVGEATSKEVVQHRAGRRGSCAECRNAGDTGCASTIEPRCGSDRALRPSPHGEVEA